MKLPNPFIAFLIAPAIPAAAAVLLLHSLASMLSGSANMNSFLEGAVIVTGICYVITFLCVMPMHLFLQKIQKSSLLIYALSGFCVNGIIGLLLIGTVLGDHYTSWVGTGIFSVLGALSSASFYLLGIWNPGKSDSKEAPEGLK